MSTDVVFDVLLVDAVGTPFNSHTADYSGLGGSEWQAVLLLEGLAQKGLKVACLTLLPHASRSNNDVLYLPMDTLLYTKIKCKTLILLRTSPKPINIECEKTLIWATDMFSADYDVHLPILQDPNTTLVGVSLFQLKGFPKRYPVKKVIYNQIPDWVYDLKPNRNTKADTFIYASAALKGLQQTVDFFSQMRTSKPFYNATLKVLNPGYDQPAGVDIKNVTYEGSLPFKKVVAQMQTCRNLLHISTFPETFGIVHVLAEILGLNTFVYQGRGPDALSEVCNSNLITHNLQSFNNSLVHLGQTPQVFKPVNPKDYRSSKIIGDWLGIV